MCVTFSELEVPQMKNTQKKQISSALQDNVLSLIAIFSVLALTLAVVFTMLWLLDRTEIASLSDRFFPAETKPSEGNENNTPSEYDILRAEAEGEGDGSSATEITRYSGDFSTLYALLADGEPDLSYYAEYDTSIGEGENALSYHIVLLRHEDTYRIERHPTSDKGAIERYVCDGESVVYTDPYTKKSATFTQNDAFFAEALAGIPTVVSFYNDIEKIIDTAACAEIDGEVVYYVRFHYADHAENEKPIYEEYWISAEREIVIRCRTYAQNPDSGQSTLLFSSDTVITRELTNTEKATLIPDITKTKAKE